MPTEKTIRPEERPDLTPDRNVETAVRDTFPASDPVANTASQGARAVPPERMMESAGDGSGAARPRDAVTITQRFPSAEAAKLALESLVRNAPLDRRCAELQGADIAVHATPADAPRLEGLLRRAAGPAAG